MKAGKPRKYEDKQVVGGWVVVKYLGLEGRESNTRYICECRRCNNTKTVWVNSLPSVKCDNCDYPFRGKPEWYRNLYRRHGSAWESKAAFILEVPTSHPRGKKWLHPKTSVAIGPGNWKWAAKPRSNVVGSHGDFYTHDGKSLNVSGWGKQFGITRERMRQLLDKFGSVEAIVSRRNRTPRQISADRAKTQKKSNEKLIGRICDGWKLLEYDGATSILECVKCGNQKARPGISKQLKNMRCWTCKPKKGK